MWTPIEMFSGGLSDSPSTLYTAPGGTLAVVKEIIILNQENADDAGVTISIRGTPVFHGTIAAGSTLSWPMSTVLEAASAIQGQLWEDKLVHIVISGELRDV